MPTLNKLEYLDETKAEIKTALNQFGSGITDEDTFRSYVDKIKAIYNNWQKVTGTGTDITLNNTKLAKMILELGGNTSQDGTPTPDNPVDIEVVTGTNNIKIENKNILPNTDGWEKGDISSTSGNTSSQTYIRTKNYLDVKGNTSYHINFKNTYDYRYYILQYDSNKTFISYIANGSSTPKIITTNENAKYIRITFRKNPSDSDITTNIIIDEEWQLEKGSSATSYVPHQEQNYTITLPEGMELCKIGNYQDKIFYNIPSSPYYDSSLINGSWYMRKECTKNIITSIDSLYTSVGSGYIGAQKDISDLKSNSRTNGYCKQLIPINSSFNVAQECICFGANNKYLYIVLKDSRINNPTVANWNSYLANNPLEIYYPLETPTTTPITDTTLVQQLNDLYYANSYKLQTNIYQTNENLPFIINANALMKGGN